jgi:hypothetical protein
MTLSPAELAVLGAAVTLVIGIIGYFLKRTMSTVDTHGKDINDGKLTFATKEELKDLKAEMRGETKSLMEDVAEIKENYLTKDDYYRAQIETNHKLDRIYEHMIKGGLGDA